MFKFLLALLVLPIFTFGQYFHQIPDCYGQRTPVRYSIETKPELNYTFEVVGGQILNQNAGDLLVNWQTDGQIIITASNNLGCSTQSNLMMQLVPCDQTLIWVPNSFTPNRDGVNDRFTPKGVNLKYYEMTIYNRWGHRLYFTQNIMKGWNGYYHHRLCQAGIYTYKIMYQDHRNYYHTITGKVVILR